PWTCGKCAQKRVEPVVGDYSVDLKHDGKLHNIILSQIEIPTCQNCGNVQTGIEIGDKVTKALREKVGLLFPEQIKQQRTALNFNQEQLGECIGAAKESISRWETGALIQSVSTDKLLRMFFKHPTDPVWRNRWKSVESTPSASDLSAAVTTWKATLSQAYATTFVPTDYFHELRDSIERLLLSRLMVEESKLPEVESRLSEEYFQDTVLRRAYASMKSAYHESRKIAPRRFTELLALQISELPIEPRDVVIFLVDTATPNTNIDELVTLMSRRSQIRRELSESF
ncbi:MAG: type II TA system antitoxin MqsA family protein, partial [Planctomycetota bacterium]